MRVSITSEIFPFFSELGNLLNVTHFFSHVSIILFVPFRISYKMQSEDQPETANASNRYIRPWVLRTCTVTLAQLKVTSGVITKLLDFGFSETILQNILTQLVKYPIGFQIT